MSNMVYILNGPNLNFLGVREPETYGYDTLADIEANCAKKCDALGFDLRFYQTNSEGELVDHVQEASQNASGLIINAGAYSHTSIALFDALSLVTVPIIEVHLSNLYKRENFRHKSFVSPRALGVICGLGMQGYLLALEALAQNIDISAKA